METWPLLTFLKELSSVSGGYFGGELLSIS
jgi:hypothetical protein